MVEVRWYQYGALPPIGSNVSVTGDVITYNGRIWIQALGSGSVQVIDFAVAGDLSLTELSADPASYLGDTVRIEGYLSKTLMPDSTEQHLSGRPPELCQYQAPDQGLCQQCHRILDRGRLKGDLGW